MPIELRDIRDAVKSYMDKIIVKISVMPHPVPPADPASVIDVGETFEFTISAVNVAEPNSVALKNIFWYVTINAISRADLFVPAASTGQRARNDTYESTPAGDPSWLAPGTRVNSMYVFPAAFNSPERSMGAFTQTPITLTLTGIGQSGSDTATNIRAKLIGTIDTDWLFAQGEFYVNYPDIKDTNFSAIDANSRLYVDPS